MRTFVASQTSTCSRRSPAPGLRPHDYLGRTIVTDWNPLRETDWHLPSQTGVRDAVLGRASGLPRRRTLELQHVPTPRPGLRGVALNAVLQNEGGDRGPGPVSGRRPGERLGLRRLSRGRG